MPTQAPVKPNWQQKIDTFAAMYGPFTTKWDQWREFRIVEGFLEVTWPGMQSKVPPLIEMDAKPRCACCGSKRPMSLRILTDRNGATHMVGKECAFRLSEMKMLRIVDFVSPIPAPQ
jgi:hypothetical protein